MDYQDQAQTTEETKTYARALTIRLLLLLLLLGVLLRHLRVLLGVLLGVLLRLVLTVGHPGGRRWSRPHPGPSRRHSSRRGAAAAVGPGRHTGTRRRPAVRLPGRGGAVRGESDAGAGKGSLL